MIIIFKLQTREERKMEAIMKAFERMEKAELRRQENRDRQSRRRESDSQPSNMTEKDLKDQQNDDQIDDIGESSLKRRRRFVFFFNVKIIKNLGSILFLRFYLK